MNQRSPAEEKMRQLNWRCVIMRRHVYERIVADMRSGESRGDVIERWSRERQKGQECCSPTSS